MLWFLLALLTAFATASQDAFVKKFFGARAFFEMTSIPLFYGMFPIALSLCLIPYPAIGPDYWWCLLSSIPINALAFVFYMAAIRRSPLSLTLPFLSFTPSFMIVTGYLFLDEVPGVRGLAGILVTCIGGYLVHVGPGTKDVLAPLSAIRKEKGTLMMLFVAFLYSFAAVIGKRGMQASSPLFFSFTFFAVFNFTWVATLLILGQVSFNNLFAKPKAGLFVGLLMFAHICLHSWSITMVKAAYMISIKRLSALFAIGYDALLFKESGLGARILGTAAMITGAALIATAG